MREKRNSKYLPYPTPLSPRLTGSDYVWAGTVWLPKENSDVKKLLDRSVPNIGPGAWCLRAATEKGSCFLADPDRTGFINCTTSERPGLHPR